MSVTEYPDLPGVKTYELTVHTDDRGYFIESYREDWKEFTEGDQMVQVNANLSYPGVVRAWHRHERGQIDYFYIIKGALKICAYDDRDNDTKGNLVEINVTPARPQVVRIPGHYWHGSKTLSNESSMLMYFVNRLYDYENPDEERRPWNDNSIIDPKTGDSFDWYKSVNK